MKIIVYIGSTIMHNRSVLIEISKLYKILIKYNLI